MIVSDDPSWWPDISWDYSFSYAICAGSTIVMYDWVLTFGKEVDLIWKQRWSLVTFLYFIVRYVGIPYSISLLMGDIMTVPLTDTGCAITYQISSWGDFIVNTALWVIMIIRLHAMYHQSRKMLIFLVVTPLIITIACGVMFSIRSSSVSGEQYVLSGTYNCTFSEYNPSLSTDIWILRIVWEVLALFLTVWVTVKHFRTMRQRPARSAIGDCMSVLIKNHVLYFVGFAVVACFTLGELLSPVIGNSVAIGSALTISKLMLMFVLGPRLILSIRDYHAKLLDKSTVGIGMSTITFRGLTHLSTGGEV